MVKVLQRLRRFSSTTFEQSMGPVVAHSASPFGMRILILTSEAPPVISGISTTVGALQRGLTAKGHQVDVVSRTDFPRLMRNELRVSFFALFWPRFRGLLRHYDLVNLHGPVPTMSEVFLMFARTLRRGSRPAIVYTHHCDIAIPGLDRLCQLYNWIAGKLAHSADAIVVSSHAYQDKLTESGDGPVHLIPWAVTPVESSVTRTAREPGQLRVLFVGQLREYKGVRVLLDAVSDAVGTQVSIVGDGPMRDEVKDRAARPGYEHVAVRGRLSDEELADAYYQHDVVVLPSTTTAEAFGLVLAEGMSAGCVPVASDLPGVREVAAETGLLVPPLDSVRLRAAFEYLRGDHDMLDKLSAESLAKTTNFTPTDMSNRYEEAFQVAIGRARAKQSSLAVPMSWGEPDRLFEELSDALGMGQFSLSLLTRFRSHHDAHVWKYASHSIRTKAPVARYVATRNRPLVISREQTIAPDLMPLLRRPELASSILVPVRRTRANISVLGVSTNVEHEASLTAEHLDVVLNILSRSRHRGLLLS